MSNLITRFKYYTKLKNNKIAVLYLSIFYILNGIHLFLEILYNKYGNLFDTHPNQHKFYFEKMAHLTTFTSVLELLLLIVNVVYLVINLTKYKNEKHRGMNEYLIISFLSLLSITIVSFLIQVIFAKYYLIVPISFIFDISTFVLILTFLRRAYNWVYQCFNRNLGH